MCVSCSRASIWPCTHARCSPTDDCTVRVRAGPGGSAPESQQSHDDECGVCGRAGELLCCDGCRAAFHLACLRMAAVPPGDWFCAVCADGA